ncbi:MAG: hypothetical protein CMN77_16930 [Spirochaetaceae bacterium]|nr:hypothetical protein [Spirochaetaceae bacterium]
MVNPWNQVESFSVPEDQVENWCLARVLEEDPVFYLLWCPSIQECVRVGARLVRAIAEHRPEETFGFQVDRVAKLGPQERTLSALPGNVSVLRPFDWSSTDSESIEYDRKRRECRALVDCHGWVVNSTRMAEPEGLFLVNQGPIIHLNSCPPDSLAIFVIEHERHCKMLFVDTGKKPSNPIPSLPHLDAKDRTTLKAGLLKCFLDSVRIRLPYYPTQPFSYRTTKPHGAAKEASTTVPWGRGVVRIKNSPHGTILEFTDMKAVRDRGMTVQDALFEIESKTNELYDRRLQKGWQDVAKVTQVDLDAFVRVEHRKHERVKEELLSIWQIAATNQDNSALWPKGPEKNNRTLYLQRLGPVGQKERMVVYCPGDKPGLRGAGLQDCLKFEWRFPPFPALKNDRQLSWSQTRSYLCEQDPEKILLHGIQQFTSRLFKYGKPGPRHRRWAAEISSGSASIEAFTKSVTHTRERGKTAAALVEHLSEDTRRILWFLENPHERYNEVRFS